jgi:branched-chain amino acid transport system substrate-binding protein
MGWQPTLRSEAMFYAKSILSLTPNAKVGILFQDDDFGKEMVGGLREGFGDKAKTMIVSEESFQATDPTVDSQLVSIKAKGADVVMLFAYSKQCAQAIRKVSEMNWKAELYLHLGSASVGATLAPAGLERSVGVKTGGFMKDASDPQWANDPFIKEWLEWMKKYMPGANTADSLNLAGYAYSQTLEQVLRQCGNDLSRENIMRQATNLKDLRLEALLPGSLINTSPTDYRVVEFIRLQRFNGKAWEFIGS